MAPPGKPGAPGAGVPVTGRGSPRAGVKKMFGGRSSPIAPGGREPNCAPAGDAGAMGSGDTRAQGAPAPAGPLRATTPAVGAPGTGAPAARGPDSQGET